MEKVTPHGGSFTLPLPLHPFLILALLAAILPATRARAAQDIQDDQGQPRWTLQFEAGPVWQTVNDNQIPNTSQGTRFSLVDLAGKGPQYVWRAYVGYRLGEKSTLRALVAPLSFTESGVPAEDLLFNGVTIAGGRSAEATYRFNSYRLTYNRLMHQGERWTWQLGFTAKIRDARVQLAQDGVVSTKDNVGFVPLLHVDGRHDFARGWYWSFDLDALAGGPGRAEDLALKLGRQLSPAVALELGYRTVEGGADVEEVYSFAWLHYVTAGFRASF